MKRPERVAAVDKIEEKRKPDDFIGHRNRKAIEYAGVVELADTYDLGAVTSVKVFPSRCHCEPVRRLVGDRRKCLWYNPFPLQQHVLAEGSS